MAAGPLSNIRVLDFTQAWAGPVATELLADLGAEVIKIENPALPDITRRLEPYAEGQRGLNRSGYFGTLCRGKLDVALNLLEPATIEAVKELVKISDVVMENFSPRVMRKLGLDYGILRQIRPDLVMVSISGFGGTGVGQGWVAYGQIIEAMTGLDALTGYPGGAPMAIGLPIADQTAALYGALACLAALDYRAATGQGQHVDISQLETLAAVLPEAILDYTMNGRIQRPLGNRDEYLAPHGVYRCQGEDRWIAIACATGDEFAALCRVMNHPELAADERFSDSYRRWHHQDDLEPYLREWAAKQEPEKAMLTLQAAGVPAGIVARNVDLLSDPHLKARGFYLEVEHPETGRRAIAGPFARFSESPTAVRRPPPLLGQHNDFVLNDLLGR